MFLFKLAAIRLINIFHRVFHRFSKDIPQDYVNQCKYDRYKWLRKRENGCIFLMTIKPATGFTFRAGQGESACTQRTIPPRLGLKLQADVTYFASCLRSAQPISVSARHFDIRRPHCSPTGKLLRKTYAFPSYFGEKCVIITSRRYPPKVTVKNRHTGKKRLQIISRRNRRQRERF